VIRKIRFTSYFIQIFTLVLITSTISIMLSGAALGISMKNFYENQQLSRNMSAMKSLASYIDAITSDVRGVADILANDVNIINLAVVPLLSRYTRNYGIIRHLSRIEEANIFIQAVYIYIPTGNLVVGSRDSITLLVDFPNKDLQKIFMDNEALSNDFILMPGKNAKHFEVFYCRDFVGEGNTRIGQIVLRIDTQAAYQHLTTQWQGIGGEIRVLDKNGVVFVGDTDIGEQYLQQEDIQFLQSRGYQEDAYVYKNYFLHDSPSNTGWLLVCKRDPALFFMLNRDFLVIFLPALLAYLGISVLLSWLISRNIYTPIGALVNIILKEQGKKPERKTHESELIRKEYYSVLENKNTAEKLLHDSLPFVSENLYSRLLQGKQLTDQDMSLFGKLVDMRTISHDTFFIINFFVTKTHESASSIPHEIELFCVEIKDTLTKTFPCQLRDVFASYAHNRGVLLCRIAAEVSDEDLSRREVQFMHDLNQLAAGQTEYALSAGISPMHRGMKSIRLAVHQAEETLEHLIYTGVHGARTFDQIENIQGDSFGSSPWYENYSEDIKKIVNAISTGNFEITAALLRVFFVQVQEKSRQDAVHDTQIFLHLLDKIAQYAIKSNLHVENFTTVGMETLLKNLTGLKSCGEREKYIQDICEKVADQVSSENRKKWHKCVTAAQEYIRNNYMDADLSLNTIAETVNMNSAYLSKLFKDETNENITEHIGKLRVQKAKNLLDNTYISVKEVCYAVGFSSIQNFIRTFKRYEGITPGKYNNRV
jgi:AraC-like DNA-binding protein